MVSERRVKAAQYDALLDWYEERQLAIDQELLRVRANLMRQLVRQVSRIATWAEIPHDVRRAVRDERYGHTSRDASTIPTDEEIMV